MSFTDEEKERWHSEKRQREGIREAPSFPKVATCILCHRAFGADQGDVHGEFPICDACDGD
jgi:hypothetical protein